MEEIKKVVIDTKNKQASVGITFKSFNGIPYLRTFLIPYNENKFWDMDHTRCLENPMCGLIKEDEIKVEDYLNNYLDKFDGHHYA